MMASISKQLPINRRAGKACLTCRMRKVKCDVEEHGQPCSNCLTDSVFCRIQPSKRGRKPTQEHANRRNRFKSAEVAVVDADFPLIARPRHLPAGKHTTGWLPDYAARDEESSKASDSSPSLASDIQTNHSIATVDQTFLGQIHKELTYASLIDHHSATHLGRRTAQQAFPTQMTPPTESEESDPDNLPDFIKPLSPRLTADDIDYLSRKGALEVPCPEFLNALIRCYIQYVHPFMPLVDLPTLFNCTDPYPDRETPKISILLLQAVIFAGVTFVELDDIQKAGFPSRRTARKVFYERVRLLYDLDVDADRIPVIQAALLMTFWSETPGDNKGGWHWTGIAVSLALTIGIHRETEFKVSSRYNRLRKRIWWSCYVRDRMLALGMSRPLRIRDADFNTPMLTVEDFEVADFTDRVDIPFLSVQHQTALAEMCIKMTELCIHLGSVLDLHFSLFPDDNCVQHCRDQTGRTTTILFPNRRPGKWESVQLYDQRLRDWFQGRPASTIYTTPVSQEAARANSFLLSHQAVLHIMFWSVVSTLHRNQLDPRYRLTDDASGSSELQKLSTRRIEESSIEISTMNQELHMFNLDRFLQPTVATLELPIIITQIQRFHNPHTQNREQVMEQILYCVKVMETMQGMYVGVDLALTFALDLLKRANFLSLTDHNLKITKFYYDTNRYKQGNFGPDFARAPPNVNTRPMFVGPATPPIDPVDDPSNYAVMSSHTPNQAGLTGESHTRGAQSQPSYTFDTIPPAQWSCDDVFFTDPMDFESTFGLMVDFDSLQWLETGWSNFTSDSQGLE